MQLKIKDPETGEDILILTGGSFLKADKEARAEAQNLPRIWGPKSAPEPYVTEEQEE